MSVGIGVLAGGCTLLGIARQLATKYIINPVLPALGSTPLCYSGAIAVFPEDDPDHYRKLEDFHV